MFPDLTKTIIIGSFPDTVQARFFKLGIIITLLGVYLFVPGLMTLALSQGHSYVRIINCIFFFFFRFLSTVVYTVLGCYTH